MPPRMSTRASSAFASQGAFDALRVEDLPSEEESPADEVEEPSTTTTASAPPLTRTAQKKQAKERREAKKATKASSKRDTAGPVKEPEADAEEAAGQTQDPSVPPPLVPTPTTPPDTPDMPATRSASRNNGNAVPVVEIPSLKKKASLSKNGSATTALAATSSAAGKVAPSTSTSNTAQVSAASSAPLISVNEGDLTSGEQARELKEKMEAEEKAAARAAYWKKVYERTFYTLLMIVGFIRE